MAPGACGMESKALWSATKRNEMFDGASFADRFLAPPVAVLLPDAAVLISALAQVMGSSAR